MARGRRRWPYVVGALALLVVAGGFGLGAFGGAGSDAQAGSNSSAVGYVSNASLLALSQGHSDTLTLGEVGADLPAGVSATAGTPPGTVLITMTSPAGTACVALPMAGATATVVGNGAASNCA